MGRQTHVVITCDAPTCLRALVESTDAAAKKAREIDTNQEYLQAGAYGFYAHRECFLRMTPVETCKALGLDEVEVEYCPMGDEPVVRGRVWNQWT